MAESMFDIFGSFHGAENKTDGRYTPRSKLGIENIGKKAFGNGPIKPTEIPKKTDSVKKSFLSNKGTALQITPSKPFGNVKNTVLNANKHSQLKIYSDDSLHTKTISQAGTTLKNDFQHVDVSNSHEKKRISNILYDNFTRDWFDNDPYMNMQGDGYKSHCESPCNMPNIQFEMIAEGDSDPDSMKHYRDNDSFDDYAESLCLPHLSDDSF